MGQMVDVVRTQFAEIHQEVLLASAPEVIPAMLYLVVPMLMNVQELMLVELVPFVETHQDHSLANVQMVLYQILILTPDVMRSSLAKVTPTVLVMLFVIN